MYVKIHTTLTFSHGLEVHLPTETSKACDCSCSHLEHIDGAWLQATDYSCIRLASQRRRVELSCVLEQIRAHYKNDATYALSNMKAFLQANENDSVNFLAKCNT